jgi:peptidyl-prolyl cis-trans isomerase C
MFRPSRPVRLFLFLFLLLPFSACQPKEEAAAPVLIHVDGRSVTLEQFQKDFSATLPPGQNLSSEEKEELKRAFLVQVIDRELALAEAENLGITVTPTEVEEALQEYRRDYPAGAFEEMLRERGITLDSWQRELTQNLLMEKVVRQAAYTGVTVEEEEVAAHYQEHREDFDRPEQVRARQIVLSTEAEGQRILGLLRQGEPFAEMARQHSLSPDGEQGGDLGFFARGEMPPEFDAVVFSLPVGRLSDLVKSEYGYHIFLVEERRKAMRLGLDSVQDEIRAELRAEKEDQAYQEWLRKLRVQAAIEVNWSLI